jgi:hypothetical protein
MRMVIKDQPFCGSQLFERRHRLGVPGKGADDDALVVDGTNPTGAISAARCSAPSVLRPTRTLRSILDEQAAIARRGAALARARVPSANRTVHSHWQRSR